MVGKTVITSNDHPGFIVNRMLIPLLNEACFALQEGVAEAEAALARLRDGRDDAAHPIRIRDAVGPDLSDLVAMLRRRDPVADDAIDRVIHEERWRGDLR